ESKAKTILVTSARPGEGKTSTAANLAVALAQAGRSVVLVSADLRNPRIHAVFGIGNEQGLGQVLEGTLPLDEAIVETDLPDLHILPSGPVAGSSEDSSTGCRALGVRAATAEPTTVGVVCLPGGCSGETTGRWTAFPRIVGNPPTPDPRRACIRRRHGYVDGRRQRTARAGRPSSWVNLSSPQMEGSP